MADVEEVEPKLLCKNCSSEIGEVKAHGDGCSECYHLCDRCDEYDSASLTEVRVNANGKEESWCESCVNDLAVTCSNCNTILGDRHRTQDYLGDKICSNCYQDHFFVCDCCDQVCRDDDYESDGFCTECYSQNRESQDEECDLIHDNDYSPDPVFHKETGEKNCRYTGVELEVECSPDNRSDAAQDSLDKFRDDEVYLKADGSLTNGFEIVSHPATLKSHKKIWAKFLASQKTNGGTESVMTSYSSTTCGLHVHLERNGISDLTTGKMVVFINCYNNNDFINKIAQRSQETYAKIIHTKCFKDGKDCPSRYEAINLKNSETIEFRIFKGTLKEASFFRAIEFCYALLGYASPGNYSMSDMYDYAKFCEYVAANRKEWPNLYTFTKEYKKCA